MKTKIHSAVLLGLLAVFGGATQGQVGPGWALSFDGVNDYVQILLRRM